jgi:phage tail protein X
MGRYNNFLFTQPAKLDADNKRRYYDSLLDPTIPVLETDIYVVTTIGDRLDLLAWKYYANVDFWWIISAANPELRKDSLYLDPGIQLRIPADYDAVLIMLNDQNKSR